MLACRDSPTVSLPFLRHYPTFGLHYIDYALPQAYNVSLRAPCERWEWVLQNDPKALPLGLLQGARACEALVRPQA